MSLRHERSRSTVRYETSSEGDSKPGYERQIMYGEPEVIEVVKKPGETAGFYIREGNGFDRRDGIFVSRILAASSGRALGYLRVGDEILKVNGVAVRNVALDDVVILMLVPQRLTLLIRRAKRGPMRAARSKMKADEMDSHDSGLSSEHSSDLRAQRAQHRADHRCNCTCAHRKDRNFSSDNEREQYEREGRRSNLSRFTGSMKSLASVSRGCCDRCPYCDQRMPGEDNEQPTGFSLPSNDGNFVTPMQSRMLHYGEAHGGMQLSLTNSMSNSGAFGGLAGVSQGMGLNSPALPSTQQLAYDNLLNMTQRLTLGGSSAPNTTPFLVNSSLLRRQSAEALGALHGDVWNNPLMLQLPQTGQGSPMRFNPQQLQNANMSNNIAGLQQRKLLNHLGSLQQAANGLDGLLLARICVAKQLLGIATRGPPITSIRDLYVVVEVDTARRCRTQIRSGTDDFEWDELFEIDLLDPSTANGCSRVLSFLIFLWDAAQAQHALCAYAHVSLAALAAELGWANAQPGVQTPFVRLPLRLEARGIIIVELSYRTLQYQFRRVLSNSVAFMQSGLNSGHMLMQGGSVLFGVPLELAIKRYSSGEMVPRIVRSCIEELERRGLGVTGLYKQTGNYRVKERLRELFDRASMAIDAAVDLSVESVPDVHCIASLLKDYFRELPEPLVVPSVCGPLIDTMYSCMTSQTPPLNATKLALAVLDRLPVHAQSTFTFMMDHLKRVQRKSDSNKMSTHALSCIFGPIFMCHTSGDNTLIVIDIKKQVECMRWLLDLWPVSPIMQMNATLSAGYAPMATSTSLHNLRNKL